MSDHFGSFPPSAEAPADGLVESVWRPLVGVMEAAHRGDADALVQQFRDVDAIWTDDDREEASRYVVYILRFRVVATVNGRPSAENLHDVAAQIYPHYNKVLRNESLVTLEDTLRKVFLMPELGSPLDGARLLVSACTAAGVSMAWPSAELAYLRPRIAKWRAL